MRAISHAYVFFRIFDYTIEYQTSGMEYQTSVDDHQTNSYS